MPSSLELQSVKAFDQQNYPLAKTLFLQAVTSNPANADNYLYLGKAYFFCNEKQEAIPHFKKYIELASEGEPNVANAMDLLGQCSKAEKQKLQLAQEQAILTKVKATMFNNPPTFTRQAGAKALEDLSKLNP